MVASSAFSISSGDRATATAPFSMGVDVGAEGAGSDKAGAVWGVGCGRFRGFGRRSGKGYERERGRAEGWESGGSMGVGVGGREESRANGREAEGRRLVARTSCLLASGGWHDVGVRDPQHGVLPDGDLPLLEHLVERSGGRLGLGGGSEVGDRGRGR